MLPSKVVKNRAGRSAPLLLAALIFAGCSGQGPQGPTADIQAPATGTSQYYLQQMQQSANDSKAGWQLLAIRALLKEGNLDAARQQLDQVPRERTAEQQQELLLLQAQYRLMTGNANAASTLLQQIDSSALSADQQARYYQLVIATQQGKPSLALLRAYIAQQPVLTNPADKQKNIDATWQALTQMSKDQVNSLVINANENVLQGWIDLLNVWSTNRNDPDMLKAGIRDWQTRYPQNPAAKMLPTALSNVQNFQPASTGKIALLLPLGGQAKVFSDAIQKGFNDARNGAVNPVAMQSVQPTDTAASTAANSDPAQTAQAAVAQGSENNPVVAPSDADLPPRTAPAEQPADAATPPAAEGTPAPRNGASVPQNGATSPVQTAAPSSSAQIQVYDTSSQPIDQVMAKAQQDGATLVVGPLLKDNVEAVAKSQTALNVLALNEPEQIQNRPNMCYFALSPEDEARDAAHHMWDQGKRQPLLLLPRSGLGDRVSNAFALEWQKLGGSTVLQQRFGSTGELKQGINSGAGIRLSGTPVVAQQPQPQGVSIAGLNIPAPVSDAPTAASSDGSIDSVYIVATQSELQLIKPMIAMRTSSRNNTAMYASSRSYQAGGGPDFRLEMEGLQFSDAPLLSGANPALLAQAARSFNNDYSLVRLYAMGIDAWTLANHFSEMRQVPGFQVKGNTGVLSATPDCVINRKLSWNQYRQGQIVPAN